MDERALERLKLESELRRALEREEVRVYYQPKVLLEQDSSNRIVSVEALMCAGSPRSAACWLHRSLSLSPRRPY